MRGSECRRELPWEGESPEPEGDRSSLDQVGALRMEKAVKARDVGSGGSTRLCDWPKWVEGNTEQEAVTWGFRMQCPEPGTSGKRGMGSHLRQGVSQLL